jgi:antirestriction protein ArdC
MAALQSGGSSDCRGFKQWKEAGRHVKKGSKAVYILRPKMVSKKNKETQEKESVCIGFTPLPVFALESTEGEELYYSAPVLPEIPLQKAVEAFGLTVKAQPFFSQYYGSFSSSSKTINLCTSEVQVFLHELCHAAHNELAKLKNDQDPKQEIIAELGSEVLKRILGSDTDTSGNSYKYIERYAKEEKLSVLEACLDVLKETAAVVALILEKAGI